jgi:hypothetical protein
MASPNFHDLVFDGALDVIATCVRVDACTTEPTTYTEATSTYTVGNYTLTAGAGAADYLAFTRTSGGNVLVAVIDGDGDTINNGSPWTLAAVDVAEFRDPVNE